MEFVTNIDTLPFESSEYTQGMVWDENDERGGGGERSCDRNQT